MVPPSPTTPAEIEAAVLAHLASAAVIEDSGEFASNDLSGVDHNALVGVLKSLESSAFVMLSETPNQAYQLTEEGASYVAAKASPAPPPSSASSGAAPRLSELARGRCGIGTNG